MTLEQIQRAVREHKRVVWKSIAYEVIEDSLGQWFIYCVITRYCMPLTDSQGRLSEPESDFQLMTGGRA